MEKKEAMKILKDFHDKSALFSVRTALHTIIPELYESEDEKIRKELIKHLRDGAEGYMPAGSSEDYTRWLAWVEKQGEQKPTDKVVPKFHEGDIIQFNGFGHNRYTIKNVCGLSHYINTIGEKMDMSYTDANFELIEDPDKIKLCHAWSEEDERIYVSILNDLRQNVIPDEEDIDWLKSLKGRVRPKQQWSEDDKQYFNFLEKLLENLQVESTEDEIKYGINSDSKYYYDIKEWLKSIKTRITWKPNEKQVKALRWVLQNIPYNTYKEEISGLLDQIKKL